MGRRKHKRKTRKRKKSKQGICCVGPGCPEWLHCINVLGNPSEGIKPKSPAILKTIKKCAKRYSTYKNTNYKKCLKKERKKLKKNRKTRRKRGGATIVNPSNVAELKEILASEQKIMDITGDVGAKKILELNKDKILNLEINDQSIVNGFNTQDDFSSL